MPPRRSARASTKVVAVKAIVGTLCRHQVAVAGSTTDTDLNWMNEQLQVSHMRL
jgi:hypothetical protein